MKLLLLKIRDLMARRGRPPNQNPNCSLCGERPREIRTWCRVCHRSYTNATRLTKAKLQSLIDLRGILRVI